MFDAVELYLKKNVNKECKNSTTIRFNVYSKTFILHAVMLHFASNFDSTSIHFFYMYIMLPFEMQVVLFALKKLRFDLALFSNQDRLTLSGCQWLSCFHSNF